MGGGTCSFLYMKKSKKVKKKKEEGTIVTPYE